MFTSRSSRLIAGVLSLALLLAACGGNDELSFDELVEEATGSGSGGGGGQSDDEFGFDLGGIAVEGDDDSVTTRVGDSTVSLGLGAERPDWLEGWLVLPPGLDITLAIDDPSTGERAINGIVADADVDAVLAQQTAMLEAAGYEALQDSGYFLKPGAMPIRIQAGDTGDGSVGYVLEHSFDDEQTLRDLYAAVEGRGTMTVWIQNEVLEFEGDCTLRSESGEFSSDDGLANLSVEEREGEQDYLLGNITIASAEDFQLWTILQIDDNGNTPALSIRRNGFQVDGQMVDATFSNPTRATLEVRCPA